MSEICVHTFGHPNSPLRIFFKSDNDDIEARLSKYGCLFDRKQPVGKAFQYCPHYSSLSALSWLISNHGTSDRKMPAGTCPRFTLLIGLSRGVVALKMCAADFSTNVVHTDSVHPSYTVLTLLMASRVTQDMKLYNLRAYICLPFASERTRRIRSMYPSKNNDIFKLQYGSRDRLYFIKAHLYGRTSTVFKYSNRCQSMDYIGCIYYSYQDFQIRRNTHVAV